VTYFYDEDGSLILKGRVPAEIGALVINALDAAVNESSARDVSAETPAQQSAGSVSYKRPTIGPRFSGNALTRRLRTKIGRRA
jgi:hypothetical protein